MTLITPDAASLADSLSSWERAEYVACALVAIACGGEYIADFTNWFTSGDERRKTRLAKRSTLLLIVSLAVELFCLVQTNSISGRLIGSLSDEATNADSKAQSALEKSTIADTKSVEAIKKANTVDDASGKAERNSEEAQQRVTVVAKQAEEIDSDLARTQYLISGRSITDIDSMMKQFKQYKGQIVHLQSYANEPEITGLCDSLWFAAHGAEMSASAECGRAIAVGMPSTGVVIYGPDIQQTMDIAQILLHTANLGPGGVVSAVKTAELTIFVGVRPPFEIGQARGVKMKKNKQAKKTDSKP
jgi:hypothetical protein